MRSGCVSSGGLFNLWFQEWDSIQHLKSHMSCLDAAWFQSRQCILLAAEAAHSTWQQVSFFTVSMFLLLQDVVPQLLPNEIERKVLASVSTQIKRLEECQQEAWAVLLLMRNHVINVVCDDLGRIIGPQLALPLVQARLDGMALDYANKQPPDD